MLTCFKLFYIKDNQNAVENSVDSIKKQNHNGFPLITMTMSYSCYLTIRGREEREENNYFAKFYRKKNEMIWKMQNIDNLALLVSIIIFFNKYFQWYHLGGSMS